MPSPASPDVTIFGLTTASGTLANLVDGDDSTFWAPYADGLDGYTSPAVGDAGFVIPGFPHPAIQFDFGESVRIPFFKPFVQAGRKSLGECWLIASNAPATSVDDTVQSGDQPAGFFSVAQMNGNVAVETFAKTKPIRARFWRFVFWKQPPAS